MMNSRLDQLDQQYMLHKHFRSFGAHSSDGPSSFLKEPCSLTTSHCHLRSRSTCTTFGRPDYVIGKPMIDAFPASISTFVEQGPGSTIAHPVHPVPYALPPRNGSTISPTLVNPELRIPIIPKLTSS